MGNMQVKEMKSANAKKLFTIISLTLLLIVGSSFVVASPGITSECGSCHTTSGVLTLISNSSGTVNAIINTPFTLVFDAAGYTTGDLAFYFSVQSGWADNNQFTFTATEVQDNSAGDLNSNVNQISVQIVFTPTSLGTYSIRAWTAAKGSLGTSLDVSISVSVNDPNPPTIDSPADVIASENDPLAEVTWSPSDSYPDAYEIFDNGVSWLSGPWDGSTITASLTSLSLGVHTLRIVVYDVVGQSTFDEVQVTIIDDLNPSIIPENDRQVSEGSSTWLTWSVSDLHPDYYFIFENSSVIEDGIWDGSDISISLSSLSLGGYNYTLRLNDTSGNIGIDKVIISIVDGTPPLTNSPEDIVYLEGQTGYSFSWIPSDIHPLSYEVLKNGSHLFGGPWNSTGESITLDVNGLPIGTHNYTLIISDIGDNLVYDEVLVTVFSAIIPYIDSPPDKMVLENGQNFNVTWDPLDLNPSNYEIYRNGVIIKSGLWNSSSEKISVSLDGLLLGIYNYTILVIDTDSNSASDTVWVTIYDGTHPSIDNPMDMSFDEGTLNNAISWTPSDLHPSSYEIYVDSFLVSSGQWNSSSETISFNLDALTYGIHNCTLKVSDVALNFITDSVNITVLDGTDPIIDNPDDITYEQYTTGHIITWNTSDLHPDSLTIFRNGTSIQSGGWDGESIFVSIDWLLPGFYNFTLEVSDVGSNTISDTVWVNVTVSRTTTTTITTTTTTTTTTTPVTSTTTPNSNTTSYLLENVPWSGITTVILSWTVSIIVILGLARIVRRD